MKYILLTILPWQSDRVVHALSALLISHGFDVEAYAGVICVNNTNSEQVEDFLNELTSKPLPTAYELAKSVPDKSIDKFDEYLPDELSNTGYGAGMFDVESLRGWLMLQNILS